MDLVTWALERRHTDDVVWREGDLTRTAGELRAAVDARAASLVGLGAGAVVALACADRWACLVGVLAITRAGCAAWPLRALDTEALGALGVAAILREDGPEALGGSARVAAALVLETSGSSGAPRRVLLGDDGLRENVDAILGYLPATRGQRVGLLTPLHYSYGLVGQCLTALRGGAEIVALTPGPWAARQVDEMTRAQVTGLSAVPAALGALCALAPPPTLAWVASAGAPLSASLVARVASAMPGVDLYNQYGMTEASPRICAARVDPATFTPGLVGAPLAGVEVAILGPDDAPLPAGQAGRVVARTPSAMLGYWGDPEATDRALTRLGLETGDLGFMNEHGHLHVTGRADDLVKVAGARVSLRAVEEAILGCEGVASCVALAPEDGRFGRRVEVFVAPEVDARALRRHAARALPPAARPAAYHVRAALPLRPNGKLDRALLDRERAEKETP